jgi:O-antigen/teichoic acid export membrane protein
MLCSAIIFLILNQFCSRRAMPELSFSSSEFKRDRIKHLLKKGVAFQAFPLGNAVIFQGTLVIVQSILGPVAVASFSTARTLCRSVNQSMELVNQAVRPELSRLLGAGDYMRAARLHRIALIASVLIALFSFTILATFGQTLYGWWTGGAVDMPRMLLLLFLLPIPFNALWFTSSVVHVACNHHEGLAIRYLVGTIGTATFCAILAHIFGIEGAAVSSLATDLVLIPFVLRRSLLLLGESWSGFALGLRQELKAFAEIVFWRIKFKNE